MLCPNCHRKISQNEAFCHHCGHQLREAMEYATAEDEGVDVPWLLGILGLIFFVIPPATFVLSGIGLSRSKKEHKENAQNLNSWAIALAVVSCAIYAIVLMVIFLNR